MEVLALIGMAGAGYYLTYPRDKDPANAKNMSTDEGKEHTAYRKNYRDLHEMGMSYSIMKPTMLEVTNLNEAWKPRSAPGQKQAKSVDELYKSKAMENAYLEAFGYQFYFHKDGEIPLATAQQSNPNIEIPSCSSSFRWDPKNSLTHYPRVYCNGDGRGFQAFSTREENMMNAGEPTESEVTWVPEEGRLNRENNPWGPGGRLQTIYSNRYERLSKDKGVNRSTVLAPVYKYRKNR